MTKIMPCLWFDNRIDDAIAFYTETFKSAKVHDVVRQDPKGPAFTAVIELEGQKFMLLNGGADFKFTEAVSFVIDCADQAEVDYFWNTFVSDGGEESMCGWCKDKFGLSWQVVPKQVFETVFGPDKAGANRAMQAMMQMRKLDVAGLQKAYAGA
ncbi:VOC family protein [Devosia sp. Root635]|uniref:VOC family protein n=1 Tax=Devosia sp. Root635 TaxID=1736575 RepID=UPI0006FD2B79|nr:VOC family protein [Devosia sp. Root635]KRA45469.1 3-demethylubiquinone-9 3-methyltransferase [Devosia sp. Root635]